MGSNAIQGPLWGKNPKDWAAIQEPTGIAGYIFALKNLNLSPGDSLLDIGCGSGFFSNLAAQKGGDVTGIDASEPLLAEAKKRNPNIRFLAGDMEELPFDGETFDFVCGFNSFQYAANTKNALAEAYRVLKPDGNIAVMIWGNKEDCEAATYLKAVGSLLPPPPPGAPGPFALSENQLLEDILEDVGFKIIANEDIDLIWDYPDIDIALRGLISAGPVAKAIDINGFQKVYDDVLTAVQPYIQENGHVVYRNKFRVVIALK